MQVSKFTVVFFISLLLISCKGQGKNAENFKLDNIERNSMEQVLAAQLTAGHSGLYNESFDVCLYKYSEKDLDAIIPLLKNQLECSGFKFLETEDFNKKIKNIFGRIIDNKLPSKYLYVTPEDKCNKKISFHTNNQTIDITPLSYYIIKNENFLTELIAVPELIDYKKDYPEVAKIENSLNRILINEDGDKINLYLWKDFEDYDVPEYNLKKLRSSNLQLLIHRNKYLFNDSNASLTWLMNNDKLFLESLVTTFGYVQDEKLLKWVIDNNLYTLSNNNLSTVSTILTNKRCDGTWVFNQEVLDLMDKYYKDDYYRSIMDFILEYDNKQEEFDMPFPKKAEMIAKLLSWIESKADMNNHEYPGFQMGAFFYASNMGEKYEKEFENNDYYDLPNFEDYWEVGKGTFK